MTQIITQKQLFIMKNLIKLSKENLKTIKGGGDQGVCYLPGGGYVIRDCSSRCPNGGYPACPA
ncbi:hypothetical protein IQ37_14200 [Chryseobacterium piperi]|uniref:Bacteriocin n=2 Tax=Chryseobacterium piperi TaxID=558152 RepID=A0A086B2P4_9FLAO|nr:hypothetical protein CJF12_19665 [Chryseobacterium piperi]KFF23208.1 hypothetical protein IQ37_14200 [Chryseobacterium piperi]